MYLKIYIINAPEEKIDIDIDANYYKGKYYFTFIFPSEEKYYEFLKTKKLYRSDFYNLSDDAKKYLEDNIDTISKLIINSMPIYILFSISDIKTTENVMLDISNLSWKDKLYIINNIATNNTYFIDEYTLDEVLTLDDISCMYKIIEYLVEDLKDKSPLEQLYSIYNFLKDRPFLSSGIKDNKYLSRSLNQVLYTNPIVCHGFANYFKAMANALDISVEDTLWKGEISHISNIVYINDKKYNVVGIFAIDITWDNKKNSIKHFLHPIKQEKDEKYSKNFVLFKNKNSVDELFLKYLEFLKTNNEKDRLAIKLEIIDIINKIYQLLNIDKKIDIICNITDEVKLIYELTKSDLSILTLLSILPNDEKSIELLKTSPYYKRCI